MSKNLVFIGATISGNKGSEMMLSTSIGEFRKIYPKGQFYIFSYYPKDDLKLIFDTSNIKIVNATPFLILMLHSTRGFLNYLVRKLKLEWLFPKISWFKNHNVSAIIDISGESFNDYNILYLLL